MRDVVAGGVMTDPPRPTSISFTPSRSEGMDDVALATIEPTRMILTLGDNFQIFDFRQFGRPVDSWPRRSWQRMTGQKVWYFIGVRLWSSTPKKAHVRFFTDPSITLYMPADDTEDYVESCFFRIQYAWRSAGFETIDLG